MPNSEHAEAFAAVLYEVGADNLQSRLHGLVSGYLAGGGNPGDVASLASIGRELARDADVFGFAREDVPEVLGYLLECVDASLSRDDFSFTAFVPDEDDAPLLERLRAISQWCEGFLAGLYSGFADDVDMNPDIEGAIADLQMFAESLADPEEPDDDDEAAEFDVFEIEEYLRMATLMLHETLARGPVDAIDDD